MKQIETGLIAIHKKGIWHRDIKLENFLVYLNGDGETPNIRISDFGLSITTPNRFVPATNPVYTLSYRAPEKCTLYIMEFPKGSHAYI